jgi:hypothetical protein
MEIDKILQGRRNEILRIAANHGTRDVRVFGSLARGEAEPDRAISTFWLSSIPAGVSLTLSLSSKI